MTNVSILVGSLRRDSYARKIAKNVMHMFPETYDVKIVEIRDLPLYDNDYDNDAILDKPKPAIYSTFRQTIKDSDAVLFVSPENNRLVPACLKNAIDICSKPNDDVALKNKVGGIITHSVGKMGGYSSQKSIRLAISYFDMILPGQPEVFLGRSFELFEEGSDVIKEERTVEFLQRYIDSVVALVEKHSHKCCCEE